MSDRHAVDDKARSVCRPAGLLRNPRGQVQGTVACSYDGYRVGTEVAHSARIETVAVGVQGVVAV
jgi:hypothetical protein